MDYEAMGRRVKKLRKAAGLTQEQLAEKSNLSPSFLGHIERGTRVASLQTLVAICKALDVEPSVLLQDSLTVAEDTSERAARKEEMRSLFKQALDALK